MAGIEVAEIPLDYFIDPIRETLERYETLAQKECDVRLQASRATLLVPTGYDPTRNTALGAYSYSAVDYEGVISGDLRVVVFGLGFQTPWRQLHNESVTPDMTGPEPLRRPAAAEICLPLLSIDLNGDKTDPVLFAGNLAILGRRASGSIRKLGYVGQSAAQFTDLMRTNGEVKVPAVRYSKEFRDSRKFGDRITHTCVANLHPNILQVAGFLAVDAESTSNTRRMLNKFGAQRRLPE